MISDHRDFLAHHPGEAYYPLGETQQGYVATSVESPTPLQLSSYNDSPHQINKRDHDPRIAYPLIPSITENHTEELSDHQENTENTSAPEVSPHAMAVVFSIEEQVAAAEKPRYLDRHAKARRSHSSHNSRRKSRELSPTITHSRPDNTSLKTAVTSRASQSSLNPTTTPPSKGIYHTCIQVMLRIVAAWNKTISADGALQSGLTALIYPTILNNASDAAMVLPLANTLLFSADPSDSKWKVGIYLLVTLAPYSIIAPFIGPLLDQLQKGRRHALAFSFFLRSLCALILISQAIFIDNKIIYSPWCLYPCTLVMMLCSKSFLVLKAAITPRVVPPSLDLVQVNSRINTFASVVGTTVLGGAVTGLCEFVLSPLIHKPAGFIWMTVICLLGGWLCLRLPAKVESSNAEVPIIVTQRSTEIMRSIFKAEHKILAEEHYPIQQQPSKTVFRQTVGSHVITAVSGVSTLRVFIGFIYLFIIFYSRSPAMAHTSNMEKLCITVAGTGATGIGGFLGNILGTKIHRISPQKIVLLCTIIGTVATVSTTLIIHIYDLFFYIIIAAVLCAISANAAKVSLDSTIQKNLPAHSYASAFGISESIVQMMWVIGAALGALLPPRPWIAFAIISAIMVVGLWQTILTYFGKSLIPGLIRGNTHIVEIK